LYFTVLDVAKWANAARTMALLKPESWREMTTPVHLTSGKTYPYGFGWYTDEWNGKPILQHGGAWQGFTSQLSRRIGDDELAVVVLTNRAGARPGTIARGIMAIYEPDLAEREPPPDLEPKVTAQLREFCIRAATGKVSASEFAFFRGGWKPERAQLLMKQLAPFGEIKSLRFLERRELGDDVAYRYNATTEKEPDAYVGITFTKDGKISAFTIRRK
jgi:CubicO group peptidase (beta-lactamase class C family)